MPPQWLQSVVNGVRQRQRDNNMIVFDEDPLARSFNLERHRFGEFSMANVQANAVMEDQSHVEVAIRNALFLGVYDGHGGVDASLYCLNNLFINLLRFAEQNDNSIDQSTLRDAVEDTESQFLEHVQANIDQNQQIGKIGSCCLAGAYWRGTLYVANLGDSRAVVGSVVNSTLRVHQLTKDHNCSDPTIRHELHLLHPDDPNIVILKDDGSWRVKGIITVSRSIGDAYLKRPDFSLLDSFPTYVPIPEPFTRGVVSAEPEMFSRVIADTDKFLIFASDGLWDYMTNDEAGRIVHTHPRHGIAKRILSTALERAATRRQVTYREMLDVPPGRESRRTYHDDISVIVVFLDKRIFFKKRLRNLSYRGSNTQSVASKFGDSSLIDKILKPSTVKSLTKSITKRFKGSSGQTSRNPDNLNLLDMSDTSEAERDMSSRPKSRWGKLKKRFTLKKLKKPLVE